MLLATMREITLFFLGGVVIQQAEALLAPTPPIARSAAEFGLYIGLAICASICRAFYDARDGKMPMPGTVRRAVFIALFVGLLGGAVFMEYPNTGPGWKMATILVASFFSEIFVKRLGQWSDARLARAITLERARETDAKGGE